MPVCRNLGFSFFWEGCFATGDRRSRVGAAKEPLYTGWPLIFLPMSFLWMWGMTPEEEGGLRGVSQQDGEEGDSKYEQHRRPRRAGRRQTHHRRQLLP